MAVEVGRGGARGLLDAAQGGRGRQPPSLHVDRKDAANSKGGQGNREKWRESSRGRRRVAGSDPNTPKGNKLLPTCPHVHSPLIMSETLIPPCELLPCLLQL